MFFKNTVFLNMIVMPLLKLIKQSILASGYLRPYRRRNSGRVAIGLLLVIVSSVALAGNLYRWVDSSGKVQYTDQPPPPSAKNVQEKNFSANVIENDALSYEASRASKRYPVVLYATNCGASCDQARALLKQRGIPYTAKNPETIKDDAESLKKLIGVLEVPVLVVGKKPLKGFEADGWNAALDEVGYPKTASGKGVLPKSADDKATSK